MDDPDVKGFLPIRPIVTFTLNFQYNWVQVDLIVVTWYLSLHQLYPNNSDYFHLHEDLSDSCLSLINKTQKYVILPSRFLFLFLLMQFSDCLHEASAIPEK